MNFHLLTFAQSQKWQEFIDQETILIAYEMMEAGGIASCLIHGKKGNFQCEICMLINLVAGQKLQAPPIHQKQFGSLSKLNNLEAYPSSGLDFEMQE